MNLVYTHPNSYILCKSHEAIEQSILFEMNHME